MGFEAKVIIENGVKGMETGSVLTFSEANARFMQLNQQFQSAEAEKIQYKLEIHMDNKKTNSRGHYQIGAESGNLLEHIKSTLQEDERFLVEHKEDILRGTTEEQYLKKLNSNQNYQKNIIPELEKLSQQGPAEMSTLFTVVQNDQRSYFRMKEQDLPELMHQFNETKHPFVNMQGDRIREESFAALEQSNKVNMSVTVDLDNDILSVYEINGVAENERTNENVHTVKYELTEYLNEIERRQSINQPEEIEGEDNMSGQTAEIYGVKVPVESDGYKVINQDVWEVIKENCEAQNHEKDFSQCLFDEVNFQGQSSGAVKLENMNFSESRFLKCSFNNVEFAGNTNFQRADIYDGVFKNVTLNNVNFSGATFANSHFRDSDILGCNFNEAGFHHGYIRECTLENNSFLIAKVNGTYIQGNEVGMNQYVETMDITMGGATHEEVEHFRSALQAELHVEAAGKEINSNMEQRYLDMPNLSGETYKETRAALKEAGAKYDPEKKDWFAEADADQEKINKIAEQIKDIEAGQQKPLASQQVSETQGRYLNMPNLSGDAYKDIRMALKNEGAKYDSEKKDWFVGADADQERINKILEQTKKLHQREPETNPMQLHYKGYAYAKGETKATIVYGESKEEILHKLNEWNKARPQDKQYESCNIGQLDGVDNKYTDYHKYNMSGKDISTIYLKIPPMGKEHFSQITKELKEAGAKFNPYKKAWYVEHDADMDKIQKILNPQQESVNEQSVQLAEQDPQNQIVFKHEGDMPNYELGGVYYSIHLPEQNRTIQVSAEKVGLPGNDGTDFINRLEDGILEEMAKEALATEVQNVTSGERDYYLSVSKDINDNRCTIWFNDGRDSINLNGDQFGVHFPTMEAQDIDNLVKDYLAKGENIVTRNAPINLQKGEYIDCYVPVYSKDDQINDIRHLSGEVVDVKEDLYMIKETDGRMSNVWSYEIYSEEQTAVLFRAQSDKLSESQFNMVANHVLSADQMEEIRFGFKDGLTTEQVGKYADSELQQWQMDLSRYGMQHGVSDEQIQSVISSGRPEEWIDKRNQMDKIINANRKIMQADFKKQGFQVNKSLVKKVEQLNQLTNRQNTVKDIAQAYKDPSGLDQKSQSLIKDIGRELALQQQTQLQMTALCV